MAVKKAPRHNARFEFSGNSFPVYVTRFSYSHMLTNMGTSQARQSYTMYPNRVEQSELSVDVQFRSPDEYRKFADFINDYHRSVTGVSKPDMMHLKSSKIRSGGIDYGVAIKSVPFKFDYKMVAPKMTLSLTILKDMLDSEGTSSEMTGTMTDVAVNPVSPAEVKDGGDEAFTDGNRFMR